MYMYSLFLKGQMSWEGRLPVGQVVSDGSEDPTKVEAGFFCLTCNFFMYYIPLKKIRGGNFISTLFKTKWKIHTNIAKVM